MENRTALVSSHVINKHTLSTYGMPSTALGDGETKGKSAAFPLTSLTLGHMEVLWNKDFGRLRGQGSHSPASSVSFQRGLCESKTKPNPELCQGSLLQPEFALLICSRNSKHIVPNSWTHLPAAAHDLPEIGLLFYSRL